MSKNQDYIIVSRWLVAGEGWKEHVYRAVETSLETAWRIASSRATELDHEYGDGHFWTVDVKSPDGGSFVQLFHGRLT